MILRVIDPLKKNTNQNNVVMYIFVYNNILLLNHLFHVSISGWILEFSTSRSYISLYKSSSSDIICKNISRISKISPCCSLSSSLPRDINCVSKISL